MSEREAAWCDLLEYVGIALGDTAAEAHVHCPDAGSFTGCSHSHCRLAARAWERVHEVLAAQRKRCPHGEPRGLFCLHCAEERIHREGWEPLSVRMKRQLADRGKPRLAGLAALPWGGFVPTTDPELRENTLDREWRRRGIVDSMLQMPPFLQTSWCHSPGTHAPDCQCAEVG